MTSIEEGSYREDTKWLEIHEVMIDSTVRLEKALKPRIAKLKLG